MARCEISIWQKDNKSKELVGEVFYSGRLRDLE